jgi:hypothetical protein
MRMNHRQPVSERRFRHAHRATALILLALAATSCGDSTTAPEPVTSRLHVNVSHVSVRIAESRTLVAGLRDANGNALNLPAGFAVSWTSSDPTVAQVHAGTVTGVSAGTATITASAASYEDVHVSVTVANELFLDFQPAELGRLNGSRSNAWAVSDAGDVVGWSDVSGGRAVLWRVGAGGTDLLGLPAGTRGMNADGAVVGYYNLPAGGQRGFAARAGVRTDLPGIQAGHSTIGFGINRDGIVSGVSHGWAVVWESEPDGSYGEPRSLGLYSNQDGAYINGRGDVAFTARTVGCCEPVLWLRGDGGYGTPISLGRDGPGPAWAMGINDAGVVVGYQWTGLELRAVAWLPADYSQLVDLGPGQAWHINNRNQVVGTSGDELATFGGVASRPALWILEDDGVVTGPLDLGTPPSFEWGGARFISDTGWIAGSVWGPPHVMATRWRLPQSLRAE